MLKKTITYLDLDGNEVVEDFYFKLNKAEIAEMELSQQGGLSAYLEEIVESNDGGEIIAAFKEILMSSVGRRSEDGRRFVKSEEIRQEFEQTEAYSELFMELVTDAEAAIDFVKGVIPDDLDESIDSNEIKKTLLPQLDDSEPKRKKEPAWMREGRDPTHEELVAMSKEELQLAFEHKRRKDAKS